MIVLVVCIPVGSRLSEPSAELIGGARGLVSTAGGTVAAAVLGSSLEGACHDAAALGADLVYAVDDPALLEFDAGLYLQALAAVVRQSAPAAVLFSADARGAELAPRLAHRLGTGAVTEAASVSLAEGGELLFTRPVYGGRLMAEMVVDREPAVATVVPGSLAALPRQEGRRVEVRRVEAALRDAERRTRLLETRRAETSGIPLESARVVVAGGRGLGEGANLCYVEELASVLGAAVGASRAAVDAGWAPSSAQVGQTGKSVAPDLYIAVGIAGATQHVAGLMRAKQILVINADAEAPFFRIADLGIAVDFKKVLPPLTARLKELLGDAPQQA